MRPMRAISALQSVPDADHLVERIEIHDGKHSSADRRSKD